MTYVGQLHALADELGIAEDVVWVGGVPLEETVHFYRAADVFVYPSFNETFGLPILEAMATGCPVVTSDTCRDAGDRGRPRAARRSARPGSIADALVEACGPAGRAARGRLGPERAAEFTWAATAERTLEVYREVYARRQQDRRPRRRRSRPAGV